MVDNMTQPLRDWLLPAGCRLCQRPTEGALLCPGCQADLPWNSTACPNCAAPVMHPGPCVRCARLRHPPLDHAHATFRLAAPIQQFIHGLKYRADFAQARLLGTLVADRVSERAEGIDALVPVPLHRSRLRQRGYNQALELGRVIGKRIGRPCDGQAVVRVRATEDQIGQRAAARRRNMRGAFVAAAPLQGLRIALIDDVMTTGATLTELARCCRRAGAAHVEAWTVARTP